MSEKKKIIIFGIGYVGLSLGVMLSSKNIVTMVDIDNEKVEMLNAGKSPLNDELIKRYLAEYKKGERLLDIKAIWSCNEAESTELVRDAEFIIIAVSTDLDLSSNMLNTNAVESVIKQIVNNKSRCPIIIKSTIPIGFTQKMRKKYNSDRIFFSPEFSRENLALYDNLHPDRIVIGTSDNDTETIEVAKKITELFSSCAEIENIPVAFMRFDEAEAVKLFSNTYLAMRVAFFNELDSFALSEGLSAASIIEGMCLDTRIGQKYNNPSFGYGGYCLPKDSKQLLTSFYKLPHELMSAIIASNESRKKFISEKLIEKIKRESFENPRYTVGLYRITMKSNSDNYRNSSTLDILDFLNQENIMAIIYEPTLNEEVFRGNPVEHNIEDFKKATSIIVANRYEAVLEDVEYKVFTRDLYREELRRS